MSNGKNGRKNLALSILGAGILIVACLLEFYFNPSSESQNTSTAPETTQEQSNTQTTELENPEKIEGELKVYMIDVGQADSFLFVQNEQVALVDCGTRSTGENVVKYLNELGINKIDYLFGTHPHDDHMGGMYDVITNFEIGKIIIPEVEPGKVTSNWYAKLMKEIKDKNYNVEYPVVGTTYNLGKSTMKVIASMKDPENNLNNYSTVLKVSFGDMDIIMTGDAETEVEKEILQSGENIEAEILKIGHHGSNTSTSDEFLEAVNPDYALISAKVGNKYEHPVKSTMEKLKNNSIIVYRTDESGTVEITITTDDVSFSCEPGDYLCGVELEEKNTKWQAMHQ